MKSPTTKTQMTPQRRFYKAQLDLIIAQLPLVVHVCDSSQTVTLVSLQGRHYHVRVFATDEFGVSYFARSYKYGRDKFLIPMKLIEPIHWYDDIPDAPIISLETLFQIAQNPKPVVIWLLATRKPFFREHPLRHSIVY